MRKLKYGNIELDIKWNWPNEEVFENWKKDFLSLEESKDFDIYLTGGFLEKMNGRRNYTPDIDIIIVGDGDLEKIETLIYEGTKIGLEKYQVFFDIFWFESFPLYSQLKKDEIVKINGYLLANKWIVDGVVKKEYKAATQVRENLWSLEMTFPSYKQKKLMEDGFVYSEPILINK